MDGIIDPELFAVQPERILFIAKEHNLLKKPTDELPYAADYTTWWKLGVNYLFSHRISSRTHGILNNFTANYDDITIDDKKLALRSVAFINVKKSSGKASANPEVISKYIVASQKLLHEQIHDIAPTLTISCFRYDYLPNQLFDGVLTKIIPGTFSYGRWKGVDVINFYHPSARKKSKWLYEKLEEAFAYVQNTRSVNI
ncbi:hypothetical protein [Dyadobacter frigoris]|uniref:Uracil-DNA glycosylase n=1 Tax=Dyadobacter frigoris TaxID=2576211 RepID=A0A4U6CWC4_9BACT|nr:hypothetical protein [Dyadobacter frigoris]TKT88606.1 hypothetical protein FDK13_27055 [Dyadobacter frigoris]GLU54939.1 hypothetical protein Dfri01_44000 [Dyadobacter frigoris]